MSIRGWSRRENRKTEEIERAVTTSISLGNKQPPKPKPRRPKKDTQDNTDSSSS